MNRINRRRFVAVTSVAATSAVLVACGNEPADEDELNPTQIPDVPGAPPTLAPMTGTPGAASPESDGGGEETGSGGGEALTITAHDDFSFDPDQPEVYPGQTITVVNGGFMQHDLVCDDLGIGTDMLDPDGGTQDIVIPEDATVGEKYHFICTVPGHEQSGMVGDFNIVEAGAAAPTEDEGGEEEASSDEGATGGGEAITITAHDDFSFDPDQPEVYPGQTVTVVNGGFMQHDLVCDDLGIGTDMLDPDGGTQDIVIPEDATVGEKYHFICTVPGHEQSGMVGDFIIVEAGAAAPAGDESAEEEEATPGEEATATSDEGAATGGGEALTITAHDDFSFDPDQPEVYPGQTVTVVNEGFMQHDLVSDDLGIGTDMLDPGGGTQEIVIPEDATVGESYHFICTVPGHEQSGMVGDFTIVEAGAAAPSSDEGAEEAPADDEATAEGEEEAATAVASPAPVDNSPTATTVVGTQWEFNPAEFEMAPGGTLTFQNNTDMLMGISVEEWGADGEIKSVGNGSTGELTIPEDAEVGSTVEFKSNLSEAEKQGMVGTITIVAGDGAAATPEADGSGDAVTVEGSDDFKFTPSDVEVSPGQTVTFTNVGYMQHDLVCEDLGIGTELLSPNESEDLVIPDDASAGESYEFICTVPGHEQSGMVGKFVIV